MAPQPFHCGGSGAAFLDSTTAADCSSRAAVISKFPTLKTSPWPIVCWPGSRASLPSKNVPFVLMSDSIYAPSEYMISKCRDEICKSRSGRHQSTVGARPTIAPRRSSTNDSGAPFSRLWALRIDNVSGILCRFVRRDIFNRCIWQSFGGYLIHPNLLMLSSCQG